MLAQADVVQAAVAAQGDHAGGVDFVVADAVVRRDLVAGLAVTRPGPVIAAQRFTRRRSARTVAYCTALPWCVACGTGYARARVPAGTG
jgi:hypothetical protein